MLKATSNRWDSFTYDNFDRLTSWQDAHGTEVMNYNNDGSLNNAPGNGLGNYTYTNYSRYVFNGCGGSTGAIDYIAHPVNITYNMFKDPILITRIDGYNSYAKFEYNLSYQRSYDSLWSASGFFNEARYYSEGNIVEVRIVNSSTYKFITYLDGDPYSARVIHIKQSADYWNPYTNGAINDYFYLHRDNQATIIAISNSSGIIAERRFFDAWGNLKSGGIYLTYRGYTGHEHFNLVRLIHCNARLYDPVKKMFLTPDNILQDPYDPQNYNRFGYCLNNPLKYNDPSGNFIPFFIIPSFSIDNNGSIGFSLSFVLGIPHALNVSATIGYAGGQGYITAGVQGGGAYAYIGYGGQSGWMAGVGFSFLPPGAAGNFSVGTNIGSLGLSWSEYGGVSASAFGFSISSRGVDFNPSISLSYAFLVKQPPVVRNTSSNNSGQGNSSTTANTTSSNKIDNVNTYYKVQSSSNSCSIDGNGAGGSGTASNEWDNVGTLREVKLFGQTYLERSDGSWEPSQAGYTTLPEVTVTASLVKSHTFNDIATAATILGIQNDAKTIVISLINRQDFAGLLKYLENAGRFLGVINLANDVNEFMQHKTPGNFFKVALSASTIFGRINPWTSIILGLSDVSGATNWFTGSLDNLIYNKK